MEAFFSEILKWLQLSAQRHIVQLISKRVIKRHVFMINMDYRGHKWHSGCAE